MFVFMYRIEYYTVAWYCSRYAIILIVRRLLAKFYIVTLLRNNLGQVVNTTVLSAYIPL